MPQFVVNGYRRFYVVFWRGSVVCVCENDAVLSFKNLQKTLKNKLNFLSIVYKLISLKIIFPQKNTCICIHIIYILYISLHKCICEIFQLVSHFSQKYILSNFYFPRSINYKNAFDFFLSRNSLYRLWK